MEALRVGPSADAVWQLYYQLQLDLRQHLQPLLLPMMMYIRVGSLKRT
jgi:hypothetical protein